MNQQPKPQTQRQRQRQPKDKRRKRRLRTWMIFLIPPLCFLFLIIGAMIGYSQFGGRSPWEALDWETWKHMFDLVFAD